MKIDDIKIIAKKYLDEGKIESDFIEYKKSHFQKDKILKTMCAFANNISNRELSLIYIGVEECNENNLKGTPKRPILGYDEKEIETIENSLKALLPFIKPKVNFYLTHIIIDDRAVIIMAFLNNNNGPYEVIDKAEKDKSISLKRGRYIRIERESILASLKDEFNLLKKFSNYHFTETFSNLATLDDLEVDYLREYLNESTLRNNTINLSKNEIAINMNLIDINTSMIKNFAILMFSRNPEKFIPYSYIELIYKSNSGEAIMSLKEFKGPIWKQLQNIMNDINNNYLKSLTLRVNDNLKSETIYNYPYSAIEELITNAIVHKNYENPRTVQVYIYEDRIVITNYNKPLPPITIKDLNTKDSFPNRMYENPSIREMFKSLDLIESFGSGIGKAKRAMKENSSDSIYFIDYDENIEITSVVIPINKKYLDYYNKIKNLDIKDNNLDIKDEKLDIDTMIRFNKVDSLGIIKKSSYSSTIKNILTIIYNNFFNTTFGRTDIINLLKVSNASGSNYISYLLSLNLIEQTKGKGKGKYHFK